MDCKVEEAALRKAGIGSDTVMIASAHGGWHHQQCPQSPLLPPPAAREGEPYCSAAEPGGLLWEDFSVDDLLDLGDVGKEQDAAEGEEFLRVGEGGEQEGEESSGWCNSISSSSGTTTSALTFQAVALPPSATDPISVPAGDVEDLEWVSRFVDDSYSEFAGSGAAPPFANLQAPALPPASAATVKTGAPKDSSTSSSGAPLKTYSWHSCSFSTANVAVPAKARSQRRRTGGGRVWSLGRASFLCEPSSSSCSSVSSSSSCSAFSSVTSSLGEGRGNAGRLLHCLGGTPPLGHRLPPALKKKKGRKPKVVPAAAAAAEAAGAVNGAVPEQEARRRCSHCGVDQTPQWRAGPMGAKTLCNACGVRYKSGRLLPEYRPAGSPTFLSHVHSNSHRKVLEIRRGKEPVPSAIPAASCWPAPPPQQPAGPTRPYGVV